MRITVIDPQRRTALQKPAAGDVPHVTIEPNTSCNIRCLRCYACDEPMVKPLEQVLAEIDLACERRKLDSLTFLGGEPTLHPDLPAMIAHAKGHGITVQLLTNGVRLLDQGGEALVDALTHAGLDRFLLHVDQGQAHVHGDVEATRHRLAELLEARGVWFGLALTLYAGQEASLPAVMRSFARYTRFDGVLVTLAFDPDRAWLPDVQDPQAPDMAAIHRSIVAELGVQPTAYLPSSLHDDEVCWLMYMYAIDADSGACFAFSPRFNRLYRQLHRRLRGREFFAEPPTYEALPRTIDLLGLVELMLAPGRLGALRRFRQGRRADRRFQYIVLQQAPRHDPDSGGLHICWQCPDAVVRGERLVPVCIAGRLHPYSGAPPAAPATVVQAVLSHLNREV